MSCYFFKISPEYNEDSGIFIKAFHVITLKSSEETRVQINDNKPKKIGQLNRQLKKTKRALEVKAVLGRMTDIRKKKCLVHCATSNWMILIEDGKARGYLMMNEKITELDQLTFLMVPKKSASIGPGRGPRERTLNKAQNGSHVGNPAHDDTLITSKARA